jgi:hypothetical protein
MPVQWTKEVCAKKAKECSTLKEFDTKYPSACRTARRNGWFEDYDLEKINHFRTFEECHEIAKQFSHRNAFCEGHPGAYYKCHREGWLDKVCSHMTQKHIKHTFEECLTVAKQYKTRIDFKRNSLRHYAKCLREGWMDTVCSHMAPAVGGGASRRRFIKNCQSNNSGYGLFYIIKLYDDAEVFYKIGVTSRTIAERYLDEAKRYMIDEIVEIEAPSAFIWDLEKYLKETYVKPFAYIPADKFKGATECFKDETIIKKILKDINYEDDS